MEFFCLNCFQKQSFLPNKLGLIRTTAVFQLFKLCADVCRQEVEQDDVSTATDVVSEHTNTVGGVVSRDQSEFKQQEVNTEHLSDTSAARQVETESDQQGSLHKQSISQRWSLAAMIRSEGIH